MKYSVGKNNRGVKTYITHEDLVAISENIVGSKGKFNNQQWAKIRKLMKKELV